MDDEGVTENAIYVEDMTLVWKVVSAYTKSAPRWEVDECLDHAWSARGDRHLKANNEKPQDCACYRIVLLKRFIFFCKSSKTRISSLRCIENGMKTRKDTHSCREKAKCKCLGGPRNLIPEKLCAPLERGAWRSKVGDLPSTPIYTSKEKRSTDPLLWETLIDWYACEKISYKSTPQKRKS